MSIRTVRPASGGGVAKVAVKGDKVKVLFEGQEPVIVKRPDWLKLKTGGEFYVKINDDKEIVTMSPRNAVVLAKFDRFLSRENEPPVPEEKPEGTGHRKDGGSFPIPAHREFVAVLHITGGMDEYLGMSMVDHLWYLFKFDKNGEVFTEGIKGQVRKLDLLNSFLDASLGSDNPVILKKSDNVLPELQKKIKQADRTFQVELKNGFVQSYAELIDFHEEDDADWENDKPDAETESDDDWEETTPSATNDADIPF